MHVQTWRSAALALAVAALCVAPLGAIDKAAFDGKPAFKEGDSFGYYLWRDGNTWKVRWTTFGANRIFAGSVHAVGGVLTDLKGIDVDTERKVLAPGRPGRVVRGPRGRIVDVRPGRAPVVAERAEDHITREDANTIRFRTRTDDDIDGFDFRVGPNVERIRFVLEIDGASRPVDVHIGRHNAHPADNPFVVPLR